MNRRFRCGRLISTGNGVIKKVELEDGGGTRFCNWDPINMDFEDIHHRLLDIFRLDENKYKTSLYDFQRQPLDINQYHTFLEYFNKNGLNCNSTVIYICTDQADNDDDDNNSTMMLTKKRKTSAITTSSQSNPLNSKQKISIASETTSTITSVEMKHVDKYAEESNQEQTSRSSSVYSFENSNNDLVNNIHILISQNSFDEILIQLFEYICVIHGYVRSIIHPLQQQIQNLNEYFKLIDQSEMKLYSHCLNNVSNICQSIETLIKLNKKKFDHIEQFPIIVNSFSQFYENLKILYNQWFEYVEKNNNRSNTPSSSVNHPIESISSTFLHSNIQVSSEDRVETNVENSEKRLQTSSSSAQEPSDGETNKKFSLFRQLFGRLNTLLFSLSKQDLPSYTEMVELTISELKSLRLNIDLFNYHSILNAKSQILLIRNKFSEKFSDYFSKQSKYTISQQITTSYDSTMKAMQYLLTSLNRYQLPADKNNKNEESYQSSTSSSKNSRKQYRHNNSMKFTKGKSRKFPIHKNDKRLTASYSSTEHRTFSKNDRKSYRSQ
ncbi:unnamed protein product [Rotaria sordida]|uniref:Uncharacterized protein n=1 Tax=Rotaria sordida TaxID=392033 RepID=A0A815KTD1_9BILA|nr:unnamed protein product [Rotaria sordida]CAF1623004.1 unnamed protein product [Rotaria sordida]